MANLTVTFGDLFKEALFKFVYHDPDYSKEIEEKSDKAGYGDYDQLEEITGIEEHDVTSYGEFENHVEKAISILYETSYGRRGSMTYKGSLVELLNELVFKV